MALKMTANELELQTNYYKFITQEKRQYKKAEKNSKKFQKTRTIKMDKARKKVEKIYDGHVFAKTNPI